MLRSVLSTCIPPSCEWEIRFELRLTRMERMLSTAWYGEEFESRVNFLECGFQMPAVEQFDTLGDMLSDERPSPDQIAALRALSGEKRLRLAEQLYWFARKMKAAGLRHQHPDWGVERVNVELARIFRNAGS